MNRSLSERWDRCPQRLIICSFIHLFLYFFLSIIRSIIHFITYSFLLFPLFFLYCLHGFILSCIYFFFFLSFLQLKRRRFWHLLMSVEYRLQAKNRRMLHALYRPSCHPGSCVMQKFSCLHPIPGWHLLTTALCEL